MMPYLEQNPFIEIHLEETHSTSLYLRELADKDEIKDFTLVRADYQTAGRGQRGNSWEAEEGKNLLFSFLVRPSFLLARDQFLLSQITSLSIKEELDNYAEGFSIKWPNDIYWNDKKICGMLIENDLSGMYISQSMAGIGININQELFSSPAPNPVSLKQITGQDYDKEEILQKILYRYYRYYQELAKGDIDNIIESYRQALFRKEGMHRYGDDNGEFLARIVEVEPDGHFVLQDESGKIRRYVFKEVQYII